MLLSGCLLLGTTPINDNIIPEGISSPRQMLRRLRRVAVLSATYLVKPITVLTNRILISFFFAFDLMVFFSLSLVAGTYGRVEKEERRMRRSRRERQGVKCCVHKKGVFS